MKRSNLTVFVFAGLCCICTGIFSSTFTTILLSDKTPEITIAKASTSDRVDGYLTCTAPIDAGIDALYLLDSSTGLLKAGVLAKNAPTFQAQYTGNVTIDLAKVVALANGGKGMGEEKKSSRSSSRRKKTSKKQPKMPAVMMPSEPKYIMSAGLHDIPGTGQTRPGASALYVTEVNTGITLVYLLPWTAQAHNSNTPIAMPIAYHTFHRFIVPLVSEEAIEDEE